MRWALGITVLLVVLTGVYIASPLIALSKIGADVEARNGEAVQERIDFRLLRRSFRRQIGQTYREMTGKTLPLNAMARRWAVSVTDPVVAQLMAINGFLDLLAKAKVGDGVALPIDRAPVTAANLKSAWRIWLNSEYLGKRFYVYLPPDRARADQFQLELRLSNWTWKIAGVELPKDLREKIAKELIEARKEQRREG